MLEKIFRQRKIFYSEQKCFCYNDKPMLHWYKFSESIALTASKPIAGYAHFWIFIVVISMDEFLIFVQNSMSSILRDSLLQPWWSFK